MARLERGDVNEDFYLYVEEFGDFRTPTFELFLMEAGKYGISLALSHQNLSQLPPSFQSAILSQMGTIITFRVSGEDARKLEQEFAPIFKAKDMVGLGAREFYIKMVIGGNVNDPFSAEALKVLSPPHASLRAKILELSRRNYSNPAG